MSISSTSNQTATSGTAAASSSSNSSAASIASVSSADTMQSNFLKLLVAQLNNQDPTNPVDNAQMTSQMAQINTVSGINQLNTTMTSMASQFAAMQAITGTNLIGQNVMVSGNNLPISNGTASGAVTLNTAATDVTVTIQSPGGQTVGSIDLGALAAGQHSFTWDASKYTQGGTPTFTVNATNNGTNVPTTSLSQDTVAGIGTSNSTMTVQLKSGTSVPYSSIQSVF